MEMVNLKVSPGKPSGFEAVRHSAPSGVELHPVSPCLFVVDVNDRTSREILT